MRDDGPESFLHHDEGLCPESYYSNHNEGLCSGSFTPNDEGLCLESCYSNTLRAYALIGTTCILRSLSLHLSSVVSSLMHCRRRRVVNELIRD